jgi:hypothetical protein
MERHMNKHYPPGPDQLLDCPERGCGRVGEHRFKRIDHLTEHLTKAHGKKTRYLNKLRKERIWEPNKTGVSLGFGSVPRIALNGLPMNFHDLRSSPKDQK